MKRIKKIIYILAATAILFIMVLQLRSNKKTTQDRVYHYNKTHTIPVQAMTVMRRSIDHENTYAGTFEPVREARISTDIQGIVISVFVDAGSMVTKGQALIQLDTSMLRHQLEAVEIQVEGLVSDVNRYRVLVSADAIQGVQLEKAELGLKSAQVQKATLREQINKTTIRAPFSGIITAKLTEEGAFAAPGMPLLQITDISRLKFTINVPEEDLNRFSPGLHVPVNVDIYPGETYTGRILLSASKANAGHSFPVEVMVQNTPDHRIRAGMFGKLVLHYEQDDQWIIIPASTVTGSHIKPQVYKIIDQRAWLKDIIILKRFGDKIVVSAGLSEGDTIITGGFVNLFNGANVISN